MNKNKFMPQTLHNISKEIYDLEESWTKLVMDEASLCGFDILEWKVLTNKKLKSEFIYIFLDVIKIWHGRDNNGASINMPTPFLCFRYRTDYKNKDDLIKNGEEEIKLLISELNKLPWKLLTDRYALCGHFRYEETRNGLVLDCFINPLISEGVVENGILG